MLPLLIAALLGLSGILIVIYPVLGLEPEREGGAAEPLTDVTEREQSAKSALREVDFDYRLGNLNPGDYQALRDRYERRALAALRTRYEREQGLDKLIDEQLAAMREGAGTPAARPPTGERARPVSAQPVPASKNGHEPGNRGAQPRRRKGL